MADNFRKILESKTPVRKATAKKADKTQKKGGKFLAKLHKLDDQIEDFIGDLEGEILGIEDNPVYVKKASQLLANMSKEYSEFIVAIRAIVNAVDRKGQILPAFERTESKIRSVMDGEMGGGGEEEVEVVEEPADKGKSSPVKEALELQ